MQSLKYVRILGVVWDFIFFSSSTFRFEFCIFLFLVLSGAAMATVT